MIIVTTNDYTRKNITNIIDIVKGYTVRTKDFVNNISDIYH